MSFGALLGRWIRISEVFYRSCFLHTFCTLRSAIPLDEAWYGDARTCRILFCSKNSSYSRLVNGLPLSLAICSGSPWVVKIICKMSIVSLVSALVGITSSHFEYKSTMFRKNLLRLGPAWFICNLTHGLLVHSQQCMAALALWFWFSWHDWHCLTFNSMSRSIRDHHKYRQFNIPVNSRPPYVILAKNWYFKESPLTTYDLIFRPMFYFDS